MQLKKTTRKSLSVKENADLIKEFDKSINLSDQIIFSVLKTISTLSLHTILKRRSDFLPIHEGISHKKIRFAKYGDLETILRKWFMQIMNSNMPESGPILRGKPV